MRVPGQLSENGGDVDDDATQRAPSRRRCPTSRSFARAPLLVIALLVVLASFVRTAGATPFDTAGTDWEGTSDLVRLARSELGPAHVVVTDQIDFRQLSPDDGLLLLHPDRALDVEELRKFMLGGGRIVLLDDFGRGDALLARFGLKRLPSPRKPAELLRNNPQLPLAEPAGAHPVVTDVSRVVTNHPTGLAHPNLSPVLKIRAAGDEPEVAVAVAGTVGQGRFLAVGDPSIVINSVLRYAGNKTFARGLVHYAIDSDTWGKRGGRLFIAAGAFEQKGAFGSERDALSEWLHDLEGLLDQIRREGLPAILAWGASIALGLALVVWVGSRAGRLHRPIIPRFVRRIPAIAQGGVAGHAAVIAAPHATRILAVLELKSALEEHLTTQVGLAKVPGQQELLSLVSAANLLDTEGLHTLRRVLLRMSNVENMILFQRTGGRVQTIRDNEVVTLAHTVRHLIDATRAAHAAPSHGAS